MSEISSRQALISFVPRQVMLETAAKTDSTSKEDSHTKNRKRSDETAPLIDVKDEEKMSKKKKRKSHKVSDTSEGHSGAAETLPQDRPRGDGAPRNGMGREDLLISIAAFLESTGFIKTLSVFLSEAKIEANSRGSSYINLEDLFNNVIESSRRDPVASIEWPKEQGILISDTAGESNVKTKDKKGKRKLISNSIGEKNAGEIYLDANLGTTENTDYEEPLDVEKKKRCKVIHDENKGKEDCLNIEVVKDKVEELKDLTSNPTFETSKVEKNNSEKKKKKKFIEANQSHEKSESGLNEEVIVEKLLNGEGNASTSHSESVLSKNKNQEGSLNFGEEYVSTKHQESLHSDKLVKDIRENGSGIKKSKKDKKKDLEKFISDGLPTINSDNLDVLQKSGFRKENITLSEENCSAFEKSSNKRRKKSSKEISAQADNKTATSKSKLIESDVAKDEKKTEDYNVEPSSVNGDSKEPFEALSSFVLNEHGENLFSQQAQKQLSGHQHTNGNAEKPPLEGSTRTKSKKKERHPGEPKSVNAFQRIKVDDIQFADDRLQDNSYWALDDSGSGYGAKAQEVLGQVRGRDFRHEKTKKKRGTYRGGQIDLMAHSVKFNYSDDE